MIAGGIGGTTGDMLMHSLDTVKTRQQGDPHIPPKYSSMASSYSMILRQEGIRKGLYGGWLPAMLGSFPGTIIFFGTYEYTKRHLIDAGVTPQLSYLSSGMFDGSRGVHTLDFRLLTISYRILCRFCGFICLRAFRSPQDPVTTPGPLQ